MIFEADRVPTEIVEDALKSMIDEIKEVNTWYQTTHESIRLIKESSERKLTSSEAANIAKDFIMAGTLMASMARRNELIVRSGMSVIAKEASSDLQRDVEEYLKGS